VPTTHPHPTGWFQIPPDFAEMTDDERDERSRAVAVHIAACAAADDAAST
jgi:hypothetical protein